MNGQLVRKEEVIMEADLLLDEHSIVLNHRSQ